MTRFRGGCPAKEKRGRSEAVAAENRKKLIDVFPDAFVEGKLDVEVLKAILGETAEDGEARYRFAWRGKQEAVGTARKPPTCVLRPVPEESVDWDRTKNLFIEGDNLEALKLLRKRYREKIGFVYIDPPYNTGNQFVYSDKFKAPAEKRALACGPKPPGDSNIAANVENSERLHTNWLNMIYPRLLLARDLMSEDGVIFISIDDNEFANLKKVCDEIFGEQHFLTVVVVQSNKRGQTYKQISKTHEYLLVYSKTPQCRLNELEKRGDRDDLRQQDDIGKFNARDLRNRNPKFGRRNRPNLYYGFFVDPKSRDPNGHFAVSLEETARYCVKVLPQDSRGRESCWRWGKSLAARNISKNTLASNVVAKRKRDGKYNICEKYRKTTYKAKSIWLDTEVITEQGTVELGKLGMGKHYEFPKPKGLLKKAIAIGSDKNGLVLDFFAGSCTTAHAVLELNMEDKGERKFIVVQSPEPCDEKSQARQSGYETVADIGKERIRRVIRELGENCALDLGFKVFKLDKRQW